MKISAVIAAKKIRKPSFSTDAKSAMIAALPILFGIIAGSLLSLTAGEGITEKLSKVFLSFATDFSDKSNIEIFSGLLISLLPYFIAMIFCGICYVGAPAAFALTFVKCLGLGFLTVYIFQSLGLKGIEYCLLVFFPGKVILIFAMILLTQNCYKTSLEIRGAVRQSREGKVDLLKYALRLLIIFILLTISSLVDFLMILCFSGLFTFSA